MSKMSIKDKPKVKTKALTSELVKNAIEVALKGKYHFALLLGSVGTDRFHNESDVDIAVYFKKEFSHEELSKFSVQLEEQFDRDCDLIQLNKVDPIYARQALTTGRELSVIDRSFFNLWKAEQLSKYPDFKKSRKIIEENLLKRKKYV